MKVGVHYIVSVRCKDKPDQVVWLCRDGGYPSHTPFKNGAEKFKEKPDEKVVKSYDGYPWYYVHIPGSPTIYKVTEWYEKKEERL